MRVKVRTFAIRPDQEEWLIEQADKQKRSVSAVVRLLLDSLRESMDQVKEPSGSQLEANLADAAESFDSDSTLECKVYPTRRSYGLFNLTGDIFQAEVRRHS